MYLFANSLISFKGIRYVIDMKVSTVHTLFVSTSDAIN